LSVFHAQFAAAFYHLILITSRIDIHCGLEVCMSHHVLQYLSWYFSTVVCDGCVGVAQLVGGEAFMKAMPDKLVLKCVPQNRILAFCEGIAVAMKNKIVFWGIWSF